MTKMCDYYGDTLLLCQAPLPQQFLNQWRAIWQERVGLVVWIGQLKEADESKLEPYIPMKLRQKMNLGNFVIQTTSVVKKLHEYDQYMVQVYKTRPNGRPHTRSRELVFVHAHFWPDHSAPIVPAKLADFIYRLANHQKLLASKNLPGVLMHCSAGVQRSPALLAVYIGRQVWERNFRVNVLGILRYIRRHRYKAFGIGNAALQVQIVFGVMQILAGRTNFYVHEKLNLKIGATEKRRQQLDMFTGRVKNVAASAEGKMSGSGSTTDSS